MGISSEADPLSRLLDDHAGFLEKLAELEGVLDEMMRTREATEANRAVLDETLRFFAEELLPHFQVEEDVLLPALEERVGRFGSLVNVIAYEHEEVRREIAKFREARADLSKASDPGSAIEELNRHGVFTIQFLWDHFRKERTSFFPTAREQLSPEELAAIARELAR